MSIVGAINRACTQTAVYWGSPSSDGYGGMSFTTAIEILVRWENKTELIDRVGRKDTDAIISNAVVYCLQDLEENGWLFLGELDDLDSASLTNPKEQENAYEIKKFEKIPSFKQDSIIRKVYL